MVSGRRWPAGGLAFALFVGLAASPAALGDSQPAFSVEHVSFTARIGDRALEDRIASAFVLPGQRVPIVLTGDTPRERFRVSAVRGVVRHDRGRSWSWTAPRRAGLYPLAIADDTSGETMRINVFVMVPFQKMKRGTLNGYSIGAYPHRPTHFEPFYRPPAGFIEVTRENEETQLSPHFRLKQFVCKQSGRYPKYVVLRPELLAKLERLLELVNERVEIAKTLRVMSGYRTPLYNRSLGDVRYSAHQFGGAADVFVDEDGDGVMDDLNGDHVNDEDDALVLSQIVETMDDEAPDARLVGGLASYPATEAHGPFVHVDVRGSRARWGG